MKSSGINGHVEQAKQFIVDGVEITSIKSGHMDMMSTEMKGQSLLIYWMLAAVIATNIIPSLTSFWGYIYG